MVLGCCGYFTAFSVSSDVSSNVPFSRCSPSVALAPSNKVMQLASSAGGVAERVPFRPHSSFLGHTSACVLLHLL